MLYYKCELLAQIFSLVVSIFAFRKKSVSVSGCISMLIISSFFIWNDGIALLTVLFSMFVSASLLTKYKHQYKADLTAKVLKKNGPRDALQAFCNLGVAFFCFVLFVFTDDKNFIISLLCSVAASNADSWASELGVLSKSNPVLITTFEQCKPGISGGITWLGTMAGVAGSIFIALISILLLSFVPLNGPWYVIFIIIMLSGVLGLFIDSFLGATLQVIYIDKKGNETENVSLGNIVSRGVKWINNDFVNFLSSLSVAIFVYMLCYITS